MASIGFYLGTSLTRFILLTHSWVFILQTTSSSDGTIIAWDISGAEVKVENVIHGVIPEVVDPE